MTHELLAHTPAILGAGPHSDPTGVPDTPFAKIVVIDPNVGTTDNLTIALSGLGGTLVDGVGFTGLTQDPAGDYILVGTAKSITDELESVVYTPSVGTGLTTFNFTDLSTAGTMASNDLDTVNVGTAAAQAFMSGGYLLAPPMPGAETYQRYGDDGSQNHGWVVSNNTSVGHKPGPS